ncbi:MAG: phosphomannomutase/phosphoglucomutase [Acidimicrobiia bacterium]|nr:phosphomannomutase/phosphoglucomutase [Acidimicrobiia bacterium]
MNLESIFKAYDIRGRSPGELDEAAAEAIGAAFGVFAQGPVAVGRDSRLNSPALSAALARGVASVGYDVWDIGQVPTDLVYFVSGAESIAGAMITASHNPVGYNGIKLCLPGAAPVGAESGLAVVRADAEKGVAAATQPGQLVDRDFRTAYVDHVTGVVGSDPLAELTVVCDAGNGVAGVVLEDIFDRIAPVLDGLYLEPDGTFPNHHPDPLRPENLVDLVARMKESSADLGVAFDGDADRAFFVDDQQQPLSGSTTTAIIADWFLAREPGASIVHNLITSRAVPETIERLGGRAIRTRVGHSYIKGVMAESGAIFGGEHSGHYYFRDNYRADSGMMAMVVLLRVLSEAQVPLSVLRRDYEPYAQSGEINFEVADTDAALAGVAAAFDDGEVDLLDGVTVSWKDRWFNVRPSNTEPVVRLNVEASDASTVADMVQAIGEVIS